MKILLYKGKSLISKAIQFQTRSEYSHCALQLDDHFIVEAWHVGGVRGIRYSGEGHASGTVVDVYGIHPAAEYDADLVGTFIRKQLGKKYDFWSVGRFLSRRDAPANDKWFCSELVLAALAAGGLDLLHINHAEASPRDVSISPMLHYEKTIFND